MFRFIFQLGQPLSYLPCHAGRMKIKNTVRLIIQILFGQPPLDGQRSPGRQAQLDLDELTDDGLLLREAIPVRSAEYWLQLGYPELAIEELETLSERASRNPWPRRVRLQATIAATN
jgi:hypothetical protein